MEPRGDKNFGWDSCFEPSGQSPAKPLTYAEMDESTKNAMSHRKLALEKLKKELEHLGSGNN